MSGLRDLIIDAWSSLSHKGPLRDDAQARITGLTAKSWVGEEHRRRITAYQILAAYDANVSREFLQTSDEEDRSTRREYGDAGLIIDTVMSAVLGDDQVVTVPGAEAYDPHLDEEPAEGEEDERDPAELAANAEARRLSERETFLRDWADKIHLKLRLTDSERNDSRYGDSAILLGWSDAKQRPVPAVMDPGFYFPVLPDSLDSYDYPERVHFAWELPAEDFPDGKARVRRITYDLRDMAADFDEDGAMLIPEGAKVVTGPDGETQLVREYPWSPGEPSTKACFLTDATWLLDDIDKIADVDGFSIGTAEHVRQAEDGSLLWEYDLGLDFIPVVHIPNTPPGGDHYGQSSLARVLQVLDDLQNADTDAQAAAATTGSPIIGVSGPRVGMIDPLTGTRSAALEVKPGVAWQLGENGSLTTVDTSSNLAACREYVQSLRDRMLVNSRLPGTLVGTTPASEVSSGFHMQLSFGPLTAMIRQMRLIRDVKYGLLLKMVQRLYQANGILEPGETPRAELTLGAFLPSDMSATLERVSSAYEAKLISLETAVSELLEAGFAIDDVAEEVARIQSRSFADANELADATGDNDAVRDYLGLAPAETGIPQVPIPGIPAGAPVAGGTDVGVPNPTDSGAPRV